MRLSIESLKQWKYTKSWNYFYVVFYQIKHSDCLVAIEWNRSYWRQIDDTIWMHNLLYFFFKTMYQSFLMDQKPMDFRCILFSFILERIALMPCKCNLFPWIEPNRNVVNIQILFLYGFISLNAKWHLNNGCEFRDYTIWYLNWWLRWFWPMPKSYGIHIHS